MLEFIIKNSNKRKGINMSRREQKRRKKGFNGFKLAIVVCFILIIVSLFVIFRVDEIILPRAVEIIDTVFDSNHETTEEEAIKIAIKQFEKLDEKVNKEEIRVIKIQRKDGLYYYVEAKENTLEIKVEGGDIVRINGVPVNE